MINEPLYNKTVDILVQAYFNDTLEHGNCQACAVGNIVAANSDFRYKRQIDNNYLSWHEIMYASWDNVFCTDRSEQIQSIDESQYRGRAKKEIDSTGYTWEELAMIEYAFEMAEYKSKRDEWMFNGLMAVIEVLDQIHQNTDASITSTSKARFDKSLC